MRFCYANHLAVASPDISACYSCSVNLTELCTKNTGLMDQLAHKESESRASRISNEWKVGSCRPLFRLNLAKPLWALKFHAFCFCLMSTIFILRHLFLTACCFLPLLDLHGGKSGWHLYLPKWYQNTSLCDLSEYFRKTLTACKWLTLTFPTQGTLAFVEDPCSSGQAY